MDRKILLSTAYFGSIQYFTKFLLPGTIEIEYHENFIKQTYRNRCTIAGANGPLNLTVPVIRGSFHKTSIKELKIDYTKRWQDVHWRAIESGYRSAPFFDYYEEEIIPFFAKKPKFLIDFNNELTNVILDILSIEAQIINTKTYNRIDKIDNVLDYRETIRPKRNIHDKDFQAYPYHQVFEDKLGFIPNLSILDLIFNTGPEAIDILNKSIVK